jgi:hypothetical protein
LGLLALQNGLIDQGQLVAAFQAWTRDRARPLAEHLLARGDLDPEQRIGVEAMVGLHRKKYGDDAAKSLAALSAGWSTRESLAAIEDALDPLRGRDDFRLLLMDLALPADPFAAAR